MKRYLKYNRIWIFLKAAITLSAMGDVYFNVGCDEDALKA